MTITVFLADDHAIVRDGLRALLEVEPDIRVVGDAANGRDAVRAIAQDCVDVAILDITMPELNGIDAARQIRDVCPSTQVVILSMHATNEHIFRALQAGALGFVLKESAGAEVVAAVHAVHNSQRHLSQKISNELIDNYLQMREGVEESDPLSLLSPREREILQLVVEGHSNADIAESLSLSQKTVETYRSRLMKKLDIHDLPNLTRFAMKYGLTGL